MALDIAALSSSLADWELAGYAATAVVIIGCVGESLVEFTKLIPEGKVRENAGKASAIILVLGLAFEILTQVNTNSISGSMIADLNNEAAQAKNKAEQLKQLVQWRELTVAQEDALARALAQGKGTVTFAYIESDPESEWFALHIANCFGAANKVLGAKWIESVDPRTYLTTMLFDITIPGPVNSQVMQIRNAFNAAKIPFSIADVPPSDSPIQLGAGLKMTPGVRGDALIMIGQRQPPIMPELTP